MTRSPDGDETPRPSEESLDNESTRAEATPGQQTPPRAASQRIAPATATDDESADTADSGEGKHFSGKIKKPKKKGSFWKELPILIVVALVLTFLIQTFLARVYVIPSGSMEQTLNGCAGCVGDRILVDKVTYRFSDVEPGDVVVFKGPQGWEDTENTSEPSSNVFVHWLRQFGSSLGLVKPDEYDLVKRVIAKGGQTVSCCDTKGRLLVDGKPLAEPYVYFQPGFGDKEKPFGPVKVPEHKLWMMGDNRNNSLDSRYQNGAQMDLTRGAVPEDNVIGKARVIIWPPSNWGGVRTEDPQAQSLQAPDWQRGLPLGAGFVLAFPVVWTGRRVRRTVLAGKGRRTEQ